MKLPAPEIIQEFAHLSMLDFDSGCLIWIGYCDKKGYARVCREGSCRLAHRYLYQKHVGEIPKGYTVDHLCRNRACINPNHLEAVPHIVNVRRGTTGAKNRAKTLCPLGHPYSGRNKAGSRFCSICIRDKKRASRLIKTGGRE